MKRMYLRLINCLFMTAVLACGGCNKEDSDPHEGEGLLTVAVAPAEGLPLTVYVYGEDKTLALTKEIAPGTDTYKFEEWLPVGRYNVVAAATGQKETELGGSDNQATLRLGHLAKQGSYLSPLGKPVYLSHASDVEIGQGKTANLSLTPADIRCSLRLRVNTGAAFAGSTATGTLAGVASAIHPLTGEGLAADTLALTFTPSSEAGVFETDARILGLLLKEGDTEGHLFTFTLRTPKGETLTCQEELTEKLLALPGTGNKYELELTANPDVRIRLYTGIHTRAAVDTFDRTPVCIAAGTAEGKYTEHWEGTATADEIHLVPERFYPRDGSAVYLRGYYPVAPLVGGQVKYTLTGQEDLMLSVEQSGSLVRRFDAATTPLTYGHLLSQLNFTLKLKGVSEGYTIRSVKLEGLASTAVVDLSTGSVIPSGQSAPVVVYAAPGTGGFPIVDGVAALPGYVLVQPEATLTLDLVLISTADPSKVLNFPDLPVRFDNGSEGGNAYNVEISLEIPDKPDPKPDPDPEPDPNPDPDPDPVPKPDPEPDPDPEPKPDDFKIIVTAHITEWNKGENGSGIL